MIDLFIDIYLYELFVLINVLGMEGGEACVCCLVSDGCSNFRENIFFAIFGKYFLHMLTPCFGQPSFYSKSWRSRLIGLLPRQEAVMKMELFAGCMDVFWLLGGRLDDLMEFGELLQGKYFLRDFWRKYLLMINISVTILSSRKDSSKENIFFSQILVNWVGRLTCKCLKY